MDQSEQGSFQDTRAQYGYPRVALLISSSSRRVESVWLAPQKTLCPGRNCALTAGLAGRIDTLRVLLISDIHCGIFLKLEPLAKIIGSLMELEPDLVAISGDIVTGHSNDVNEFLDILAFIARTSRRVVLLR